MPKNDYGELFCQAVDTIIKERLNEISFDQTITCTIVDDSNKVNGKYKVFNGSAKFDAYSTDTTLSNNTSVYVQIPGGDWSQDKIILCRKPMGDEKPISYKDPFNSFVDITGNLITQTPKQQGLVANNPDPNRIVIWAYNCNESPTTYKESGVDLAGYTRLGLKASFQTWLRELNTVKGSYGLRLRIEGIPEDEQGLSKDETEIETVFYDLIFDCGEMPGNPYNYESFYNQEKLFDISNIYKIRKMELEFYEKDGTFKDSLGADVPWQNEPPNIFVKDIYISLGYDSNSFDTDTLMIYSLDSSQYIATEDPPEDNHKKVEIRWIHKMDDGSFKSISMDDDINYDLNWYRKELGSRSDTVYSGVDWKPLSRQNVNKGSFKYPIIDNDWLEYNQIASGPTNTGGLPRYPGFNYTWLIPDITRAEEQIKAILTYDDQVFYSNILSFTNRKEVVSKPTVDAIQALTINCEDDSYGNYLVYDLGGQLTDISMASEPREFKAYFNSALDETEDSVAAQLTEAEQIEWIIPTTNTMIVLPKEYLSGDEHNYIDEDGFQHIFRYGEPNNKYNIINENTQRYRISSFYTQAYSNNTIKCVVIKDKVTYTAVKELTFGPSGTEGTDYTFVLDFDNGETALTLDSDFKEGDTIPAVFARARLYDYKGNEIEDIESKNIVWSWQDKDNEWINLSVNDAGISTLAEKNRVELTLKDSPEEVPADNYSILKATLKKSVQSGDGGWGDFDLNAYLPIPIRSSRKYQFISGTTVISYNSLGYLDTYFQNPYEIHVVDTYDKSEQKPTTVPSTWDIGPKKIKKGNKEEDNAYLPVLQVDREGNTYIRPINIYIEDAFDNICIVGSVKDKDGKDIKVWSQPIYVYQNKYPSSIVNDWNGELKIDENNNAILAAKVVAGRKEKDDNTFSGVMMGDWEHHEKGESTESAIETGLYGFQHGVSTFGFNVDGTAFIGPPTAGRIEFNGTKSIISSSAYLNDNGGLYLDFVQGLIKAVNPNNADVSGTVEIDASTKRTPFKIGSNFSVDWDGSLWAKNGQFEGSVNANIGIFDSLTADNLSATEASFDDLYVTSPYFNTIYFAPHSDTTVTTRYYIRKSNGSMQEVDATEYESYTGYKYKVTTSKGGTSYTGYLGIFKGADENGETTVVGLKNNSSSLSTVIEGSGKYLRVGNNEATDKLILKGESLRWLTNGMVGTGEGYTHKELFLRATQIRVECDAANQHGIYARFA